MPSSQSVFFFLLFFCLLGSITTKNWLQPSSSDLSTSFPSSPLLHKQLFPFLGLNNNEDDNSPPPNASSPAWDLPYLNPKNQPYGGASPLQNTELLNLFTATKELGTYNMSPMLSFLNGMWLATWKNSPKDEDEPGQRILYSQSVDGEKWTGTSSSFSPPSSGQEDQQPQILFPNISTASSPAHLFAEPTLLLNRSVYAAASPTQFCLYPDQYQSVLLLRQVTDGKFDDFGPVFWASYDVPDQYVDNTEVHNILTLGDMPLQVQQDVALLQDQRYKPCDTTPTQQDHTPKCEFCTNGCQDWSEVRKNISIIENERSHYLLPDGGDVILYRSRGGSLPNWLYSSIRTSPEDPWPTPQQTNITDDVSNLNAGNLIDGRAFLVSNVLVNVVRDPLYLSLTDNTNLNFVSSSVIVSCEWSIFRNLPRQPDGCQFRYTGSAKQGGCQYPQSVVINSSYLYVIFSLNKEDIWLTRTPLSELP